MRRGGISCSSISPGSSPASSIASNRAAMDPSGVMGGLGAGQGLGLLLVSSAAAPRGRRARRWNSTSCVWSVASLGAKRKRKAQPKAVSGRSPMAMSCCLWWGLSKRRKERPRLLAMKTVGSSLASHRFSCSRNSLALLLFTR